MLIRLTLCTLNSDTSELADSCTELRFRLSSRLPALPSARPGPAAVLLHLAAPDNLMGCLISTSGFLRRRCSGFGRFDIFSDCPSSPPSPPLLATQNSKQTGTFSHVWKYTNTPLTSHHLRRALLISFCSNVRAEPKHTHTVAAQSRVEAGYFHSSPFVVSKILVGGKRSEFRSRSGVFRRLVCHRSRALRMTYPRDTILRAQPYRLHPLMAIYPAVGRVCSLSLHDDERPLLALVN